MISRFPRTGDKRFSSLNGSSAFPSLPNPAFIYKLILSTTNIPGLPQAGFCCVLAKKNKLADMTSATRFPSADRRLSGYIAARSAVLTINCNQARQLLGAAPPTVHTRGRDLQVILVK